MPAPQIEEKIDVDLPVITTSEITPVNNDLTSRSHSKELIKIASVILPSLFVGYFGLMFVHKLLIPSAPVSANTPASIDSQNNSGVITSAIVQNNSVNPLKTNTKTGESITKNTLSRHKIATRFSNEDRRLKKVVDRVIEHCKNNNFPTESLSITLVNTKTNQYKGYQNSTERYPASVVKLFWLFDAYTKHTNALKDKEPIYKMILKSDNQGASRVLDLITDTKSTSSDLSDGDFQQERKKRQSVNKSYQDKGYSPEINISQKTFPIPQENIMEPKGLDRQLRGENIQKPIRNRITTDDAALLMAEIVKGSYSEMKRLLTRNTDPKIWRKLPPNPIDFNPVESFFGEGLEGLRTKDIISKAGWTSASRQEVAFISSQDGKTEYILTVIGDNAAYAKSKKIFPEISRIVYQEMRELSK
jgi:hypothetical protein